MKKQKTIYILRHAKAETASAKQEDHERRLVSRGVEDAGRLGKYMAAQGIKPGKVLCSTAVRTRETCALLTSPSPGRGEGRGGGFLGKPSLVAPLPNPPPGRGREPIEYLDQLYLASANEIVNLVAAMPETLHSLMVVGHNPGLHELCLRLAKDGDHALLQKLAAKFPTCTLATIVFDGAKWRDIGHTHGTLAGFMTPKML